MLSQSHEITQHGPGQTMLLGFNQTDYLASPLKHPVVAHNYTIMAFGVPFIS